MTSQYPYYKAKFKYIGYNSEMQNYIWAYAETDITEDSMFLELSESTIQKKYCTTADIRDNLFVLDGTNRWVRTANDRTKKYILDRLAG